MAYREVKLEGDRVTGEWVRDKLEMLERLKKDYCLPPIMPVSSQANTEKYGIILRSRAINIKNMVNEITGLRTEWEIKFNSPLEEANYILSGIEKILADILKDIDRKRNAKEPPVVEKRRFDKRAAGDRWSHLR